MNVGVLLAAGASRRMGRNKSLMRTKGDTFLAHGVRQLWHACDAVVVVLHSGLSGTSSYDTATTGVQCEASKSARSQPGCARRAS